MTKAKDEPKAKEAPAPDLHELYLKVCHAVRDMPASVKADIDTIFDTDSGGGPGEPDNP